MKIRKSVLILSFLSLILSGCDSYGGDAYRFVKRGNVKVLFTSGSNNKFIKNQIWSVSKFLKDVIPTQKADYEVYIVNGEISAFIGNPDFQKHIVQRVYENPYYTEEQIEQAVLPLSADLDAVASGRNKPDLLHFIPLADIIIIRNNNDPDKDHFLYGYLSLLLFEHNPDYYLNPVSTEDQLADLLLFRYLLTAYGSFYSQYFSKYPFRKKSLAVYETIIERDMQYLGSNIPVDVDLFKLKSLHQAVAEPESIRYYAHFFKFLTERLSEADFLDLLDSFLQEERDRKDELRDLFYEWRRV